MVKIIALLVAGLGSCFCCWVVTVITICNSMPKQLCVACEETCDEWL